MLRFAFTAVLTFAMAATVSAVGTRSFVLDSPDAFFDGELDGAAVHSDGSVRAGATADRLALENVPLAYSFVQRGGLVFIGTGTNGAIYRSDGKSSKELVNTGELLVASLAFGGDGALYAGTLPNGRIFRVDPKSGKMKSFSSPEGAKHVWALRYDDKRGRLIAATGPEGKLFSINSAGVATEIYKAEAAHLMALSGDDRGNLYAGTSDKAVVLRITPKNKAEVVHDFPGNEVTAIDFHDGELAVAANQFKSAPGSQFKPSSGKGQSAAAPAKRPRPGSGQLWRIGRDGRAEMLLARKDTHFTSVQWGSDGAIYAGEGDKGRILRVETDAAYSVWIDVEERQVLALDLRSDRPSFVTGDGAAVYRVKSAKRRNGVWTSKALDSAFASKWGRLTWRGKGRFVFQTRSGNTEQPGDTWSDWSKELKQPGLVSSPAGRFIQVRAKLPSDDSAVLRALELFYLPQNQRARLSHVQGRRPPPKRGTPQRNPEPPTTLLDLSWKTENPDKDALRYRVAYREESQTIWRDMFAEDEVLAEPKYTWDTNSIPDGHYVVRVEASDEQSNPPELTMRSVATSEPIRVDNHPPRIEKLSARKGRVTGRIVDSLGPIARIQMAIDAGPWRDVFPVDSLLDSPDERFDVPLGEISGNSHIVALRAFDAAGNQANREITVKTKR